MYKATFFRGEIMRKPIPELRFNGHVLIPYDSAWAANVVTLYFEDMPVPANPITWSDQLFDQGFILAGYGRNEADPERKFVYIRAMLRGQA